MITLQQILDNFGAANKCHNWNGWVREMRQHPKMVVDKFNELVAEFDSQNAHQRQHALDTLKYMVCSDDHWSKTEAEYRILLGDVIAEGQFFTEYKDVDDNEWVYAAMLQESNILLIESMYVGFQRWVENNIPLGLKIPSDKYPHWMGVKYGQWLVRKSGTTFVFTDTQFKERFAKQ